MRNLKLTFAPKAYLVVVGYQHQPLPVSSLEEEEEDIILTWSHNWNSQFTTKTLRSCLFISIQARGVLEVGYYGLKGQFILKSTIIRILAEEQDSLAGSLHHTIHDIIVADLDSFDEYDAESELIQLQDFISFIFVPFAAALLIGEDLDLDLEDAADIRDSSNEYGDVLQPDNGDDDLIESLHEDRAILGSVGIQTPARRKHGAIICV
ncbi:hypothetical protein B0H14DRAFT_2556616 [Mycena olivaceomarginata]|nr:hypothetical protein B0H14DRAFT_2556616 [Mycena olivaceomarginata]